MKRNAKYALCLALTLCASTCWAQTKQPDGSYIVTIEGVEYRAFNAEQMKALAIVRVERDAFAKQIAALQEQVKIYGQLKQTSDRIEQKLAAENQQLDQMLTSCNALALDLKGLVDDYRRAARVGKVAKALNHPAWKIGAAVAPFFVGLFAR